MITNVPNDLVERIAHEIKTCEEATAMMTLHVPLDLNNETVAICARVQVLEVWHDGERMLARVHVKGAMTDPVNVDASVLCGWSIFPKHD